MRSQLDKITDWPERAKKAGYRPKALASLGGTCLRQLQRWLRLTKNMTPRQFCAAFRQAEAAAQLLKGDQIKKEVAAAVAYTKATNFSRDFRKFHGLTPTAYQAARAAPPATT